MVDRADQGRLAHTGIFGKEGQDMTGYIDMDGNTLHDIDYWMPIEPPQEENK